MDRRSFIAACGVVALVPPAPADFTILSKHQFVVDRISDAYLIGLADYLHGSGCEYRESMPPTAEFLMYELEAAIGIPEPMIDDFRRTVACFIFAGGKKMPTLERGAELLSKKAQLDQDLRRRIYDDIMAANRRWNEKTA